MTSSSIMSFYHPSPPVRETLRWSEERTDLVRERLCLDLHRCMEWGDLPDPAFWANELAYLPNEDRREFLVKALSYLVQEIAVTHPFQRDSLDDIFTSLIGKPCSPHMLAGDWIRFLSYLHSAMREGRGPKDLVRYLTVLYAVADQMWGEK